MGKDERPTVRHIWLRTGLATMLIVANGGFPWAQLSSEEAVFQKESGALHKAFTECLWRHTRRLANGKIPTQANGDAAISMCTSEEAVYREFLLKMPGLKNGEISDGAYAGISMDLVVLCTRQHTLWGGLVTTSVSAGMSLYPLIRLILAVGERQHSLEVRRERRNMGLIRPSSLTSPASHGCCA
jgi:hypothetical protein